MKLVHRMVQRSRVPLMKQPNTLIYFLPMILSHQVISFFHRIDCHHFVGLLLCDYQLIENELCAHQLINNKLSA